MAQPLQIPEDRLAPGVNVAVTLAAATNVTYAAYNATNWEVV